MSKNITWEKVSFAAPERKVSECVLTFRPNAQLVFDVEMLEALDYPKFLHLFHSPSDNLIAVKATGSPDSDALQLTAVALPKGEPRTISARKVYVWLCGLLGQTPGEVLIKLTGVPNDEGMIVFELAKAAVKPKRVLKAAAAEA